MKRVLIALATATAVFLASSGIIVATIGNRDHGWQGILGGVCWFGFLISGLLLVVVAIAAAARAHAVRTAAVLALSALVVAAALVGISRASGAEGAKPITFIVPVASVRAQDPATSASYFRESWTPGHDSPVVRQDSVGFSEFGRGTFLGTVTLTNGQIVYAGTTSDQDDFQYAIIGGTGAYAASRGTLTLRTIDQGHVRVTIALVS